jgi:hypothetical protein
MMLAETKTEFESKLSDFRESEKENTKNIEYFEENSSNDPLACVNQFFYGKFVKNNLILIKYL